MACGTKKSGKCGSPGKWLILGPAIFLGIFWFSAHKGHRVDIAHSHPIASKKSVSSDSFVVRYPTDSPLESATPAANEKPSPTKPTIVAQPISVPGPPEPQDEILIEASPVETVVPESKPKIAVKTSGDRTSKKVNTDKPVVAPSATPMPAWVNELPHLDGENYRFVLRTDPLLSPQECAVAIRAPLREKVAEYINGLFGAGAGERVKLSDEDLDKLIGLKHYERYTSPTDNLEPMWILNAQIQIDSGDRDHFRDLHRKQVVGDRLQTVGVYTALVLAGIGSIFGALRLDTLTRGYYTRRLQLVTAGAILALAALGALWAR